MLIIVLKLFLDAMSDEVSAEKNLIEVIQIHFLTNHE